MAGEVLQVGGPNVSPQEANPSGGMIPFRRATTPRTARLVPTAGTITAAQQNVEVTIEGSGFMYGVHVVVAATAAGNAATVAFQEDGPQSVLASVILKDVNGELVNLSGYHLWLLDIYGGWLSPSGKLLSTSTDTNLYRAVTGSGATGGSLTVGFFVPVALNRRTLIGLLGNQDRAQRYQLRTDIAPSASIYSTAPTALPPFTISRYYDNYAVPAAHNANGAPQQQVPSKLGVLAFGTQTVNPGSAPQGGSTVNHYLPRLGNTIRVMILVLRSNGSRATAESNMPTALSFKLGDMTIFDEDVALRRKLMFERYGFDAPPGVLVYDFLTDVGNFAGSEFGDDWAFTAGLVNAQFVITYPSGFGSTNNTLTVITADLVIPPSIDVYAE